MICEVEESEWAASEQCPLVTYQLEMATGRYFRGTGRVGVGTNLEASTAGRDET